MTKYHARAKIGNCSYFVIDITYKVLGIFKIRKKELFIKLPVQDCRKTTLKDIYNTALIELHRYVSSETRIEPGFEITTNNLEDFNNNALLMNYLSR